MKNSDQDRNREKPRTFFYTQLEEQVRRLERKYPSRPRKTLLSLIFWSAKQLTVSLFNVTQYRWRKLNEVVPISCSKKLEDSPPTILFLLHGGVGDMILASAYLKEFHKFIGGTHQFCVATAQRNEHVNNILNQCPWVAQIYHRKNMPALNALDVFIEISRAPQIIYKSESSTACWPRLNQLLQHYEAFEQRYGKLVSLNPEYAPLGEMYARLNGRTRLTQPDIGGLLGMSNDMRPTMILEENSYAILNNAGLENRTYITIQRGVDQNIQSNEHTKLWLKTYYNELIRMIHAEFPSLIIVQVGRITPESDFVGIDVDLRGKTNFEELKAVLKHSALHIDGECGMVHLTYALEGRSAVIFGPTSIEFFGYPENMNVKAKDACPLWCEWVTNDWYAHCLRGFDTPPCMEQLTPELFFEAIREHLHEVTTEKPSSLREIDSAVTPRGTILFIGNFEDAAMTEWVRPENRLLHFSMNLTPEQIQNEKVLQIDADYADILNIPMKKNSCDVVFCSQEQNLSPFALREVTRILKMGGVLKTKDGRCYVKETHPSEDRPNF